ncbi:TIGR03621 family F420-dependent LLM class oxidoreductase [Spongiactinospora sp. 9N601]|uniref:TIGR03621 family F420-dependent LLM class oxidoreductase n=1 Tax=Spongiactinospora sp. 9N601 TaxID=3375149 RepID=UPI00378A3774
MTPRYEFAVVSTGTGSRKDWTDLARRCEDLGYSALYVTDHVNQELAPIPALAAAAQVTAGLRLGTYVLAESLRNPVVLLRELATLDVLSDGRLDIGLGCGWLADDYSQTGITMAPGRVRLTRLAALISLIKAAWAGEPHDHDDGTWTARVAAHSVPGLQRPHPPLLVGGGSPGTLRLAGRKADVVSLAPRAYQGDMDESDATAASMDAKVALVREAATGRAEPPHLNLLVWECFVLPRPEEILAVYARSLGCAPREVEQMPSLLIGSVPRLIELLEERRTRWGADRVTIPAAALESFAPVVAALRA